MLSLSILSSLVALAAAAPAGTTISAADGVYSALPYSYDQALLTESSKAALVASIAGLPVASIPGATGLVPPVVTTETEYATRGPYSGPAPTTTGALSNSAAATALPVLPPNPTATVYNPDGSLHEQEPVPFQPAGGLGTNGTEPVYRVQSDFDYQTILLGLYQEWIELDLFRYMLEIFSTEDFYAEGLTDSDIELISFMADQEVGHATLLSNMLGGPGGATPSCRYDYPVLKTENGTTGTVREMFDFAQRITRFGESGVLGAIQHLNAREVGQLLGQSIATESRQQMIFRQFSGLSAFGGQWFETGIPQSWAWTSLAPYISECPASSKRIAWQNFPALTVLNQPNSARINATASGFNETVGHGPAAPASDAIAIQDNDACNRTNTTGSSCVASINQDRYIPLSYPGREIFLQWEDAGLAVGPNNSYVTTTSAGAASHLIWVAQLNATYSPLYNISKENGLNYAHTIQPDVSVYEGDAAINGTMFVAVVDGEVPVTAFNLSSINGHVVAGPFLYSSG